MTKVIVLLFSILTVVLLFAAVAVVPLSFADTQKLSGNSHGTEISLIFSDGKASGNIILDKQTITLNDINIIEKNDRIYIIDKQNDLKIFSKQITSDKYLIIIKINSDDVQTKLRFIANSENINKNTNQRNLFEAIDEKLKEDEELKSKNGSFRESQLLEKQKKIDKAQKKFEASLKKMDEAKLKNTYGEKTRSSILEAWEKSKIQTGIIPPVKEITSEKKSAIQTPINSIDKKIQIFFSVPTYVEWNKELRYDVFVTDGSKHKYNSSYKSWVGNELKDVEINGKITNPSGDILQSFNGTTDSNGKYIDKFLIPDKSTTVGEYTISVHALKTFKDDTSTELDSSEIFFVIPEKKNSNSRPISNAGADQHLGSGTLVTLDGSGSTDIDDSILFYTWTQTNGQPVPLSDSTVVNPTFTIPEFTNTFVFSLNVDDGRKSSTLADSVTIASLHSNAGSGQIQTGLAEITLDGSASGDGLGHSITHSWSFTSVPGGSGITDVDLSDPSVTKPTFTPDEIGDYVLQLQVNDGTITDDGTVTITIE